MESPFKDSITRKPYSGRIGLSILKAFAEY